MNDIVVYRSRLSLLKSKMRRSESGGGARGSKLEWGESTLSSLT